MSENIYNNFRNEMQNIVICNTSVTDKEIQEFSDYFVHEYQEIKDGFKLYRYMPVNYHSIRNLETETIYLSCNGTMNDIYEGIPDFANEPQTHNKIKTLEDVMFMKCFSESYDIPLMWGHYAEGTSGFCIEYNLSNIDIESELLLHIFPVIYTKNRVGSFNISEIISQKDDLDYNIYLDGLPSDYFQNIYNLFLAKGNVWEYEREWRILYSKYELYINNDNWQEKRKINFPCISAVYLGAKMNYAYKEHIKEIVHRLNKNIEQHREKISVYEMQLNQNDFSFSFEKIVI